MLAGTGEGPFLGEVAAAATDCPEPHKGESLKTLVGVTARLMPVEGGTGERKNLELPPDAE
jgi:hypothetical protein